MRTLRAWLLRLSGVFRKDRREHELAAEMESHLQLHIEDNLRAAMNSEEARRRALIKLGGLEQTKENYRDRRGLPLLETLFQDLRFTFRMLRKSPGFTVVVVLTLALGIGAATTVFSVAESILWKPLPFHDSGRLVTIWTRSLRNPTQNNAVSGPDFLDWQANNNAFTEMAADDWGENRTVTGGAEALRVPVQSVSTNFFSTLGVANIRGRDFLPGESQAGRNHVAVVSVRFWERQFPGISQPGAPSIRLDGVQYNIIGILSINTNLKDLYLQDIFIPLSSESEALRLRDNRALGVIARLRDGVTLELAQANLDALCKQLALAYPATNTNWGARIESLQKSLLSPSYRTTLSLFLGAAILLLLTAGANASGLLLARTLNRREEFAVRSALGAGRQNLIRQSLTESTLLGMLGGLTGVLLARWGVQVFVLLASSSQVDVPRLNSIALDLRALVFAAGVSILLAALTGLAPAHMSSKPDLNVALRGTSRTSTGGKESQRTRSVFVAAQFSCATVLLVGAGLFIHSLIKLQHLAPGFDPHNVISGYVSLSAERYADPEHILLFVQQLGAEIHRIPGVEGIASASRLPLIPAEGVRFSVDGKPSPQTGEEPSAMYSSVSQDYFRVLRIPLLRGRQFTDQDTKDSIRVAIVNENFVQENFPAVDPIGRHLTILGPAVPGQPKPGPVEIVGVTANAHAVGLDEVPFAELYFPFLQEPVRDMYAAVRLVPETTANENILRGAVARIDKEIPISRVTTLQDILSDSLAENRFNMILIGTTALMAVLLAALGTYGIIAFYVTQRIREIGIRIALGAQKTDVVRLIVRQSAKFALIGTGAGLAAALVLGEMLHSALYLAPHVHNGLLYGVTPHDPPAFACVLAVLGGSALAACWIPARRAMRVDPVVALRYE
jgi:predicted permease